MVPRSLPAFVAVAAVTTSMCGCFASHLGRSSGDEDAAVEPLADASIDLGVDGAHVDCDDGDPCTVERIVGGRCQVEPAPDGTTCDDGDSCTGADRCEAGVCTGDAAEGEIVSTLTPRFQNGGTGVGAERFVFFRNTGDTSELFLVRAMAERFEVLDELALSEAVSSVESLGDDIAVYTTPTGGGLLELGSNRLQPRGTYHVGGRTREVAITRDRLWVCVAPDWLTTVLHEYALEDLDAPRRIASGETHGCGSVVASTDGTHAYLADAASRVHRLRSRDTGPATVEPLGVDAEALHVGRGHLVTATQREVALRREADGSVIGRVQGTFGSARYTGRGLEIYGATDAHPGETGLSVHTVEGGTLVERSWEAIEPDPPRGVARWVSHDDALRSSGRLFVLESTAPHLREVTDPGVGWPGQAIVEGRSILLRDEGRTVRVDASDPTAPEVVSGGPLVGRHVLGLERGPDGRTSLHAAAVALDSLLLSNPVWTPSWVELAARVVEPDREVRELASFTIPLDARRRERLSLAGDHLYQATMARAGDAPLRVRRWPVEDLLEGRMEAGFDRTWPDVTDVSMLARIHGDDALAVGHRQHGDSEADSRITWLSLTSDELATFELPGWGVLDLAVEGERVLVMAARFMGTSSSQDSLVLSLRRDGDRLVEVGRVEWSWGHSALPRQVLAFDGRVAYLQFGNGLSETFDGNTIVALRFEDVAGPRAHYRLPAPGLLQSFLETDIGLVLSRSDVLHLARPWCD